MGNTPSQEAPRASSRKLSKPRVDGRDRPRDRVASSAPVSELAFHQVKAAQFSNSYLVGTVPISASQRTSFDVVSPGPATAVFHDNPLSNPADNEPPTTSLDPKSPTQDGFNELLRAERIERRRSTGQSLNNGSALPSRAPSTKGARHSMQTVARTPSVQTTRTQTDMRDVPSIVEEPMPRTQSLIERRTSLSSRSNSRGGDFQDAACNLRRNSSTPQPEMIPHRTQSETSLYPPHRRRSLVLTPGVATRAEEPKKLRRKASFRRSMQPTPSASRENSVDSKISRHMSLPVLPSKSEMMDRAPTPSETEYKQLGGMMFGTLRITNGAPAPSPGQEPDEGVLYPPQTWNPSHADRAGRSLAQAADTAPQNHLGIYPTQSKDTHPELTIEPPSPRSPKALALTHEGPRVATQAVLGRLHGPSHRVTNNQSLPVTVRPPTPELQTTSKHAAVDDHLFEEEDDSPRAESTEPVAQVIEVARELDVGIKSPRRPSLVHVSRKDSGYVSGTKSSRRTLSTVDSGYSSNISVRSTRKTRAMTDDSDYLDSSSRSSESNGSSPSGDLSSNSTSPLRSEDIVTPPGEHLQPSISSKDDASVSTPRTSVSSTTHSIIRLPSLRSGKSQEQQQPRKSPSQDRPKSPGNLLQRISSPTVISSPTGNAYKPPKMSGLRRLLSGGSRKGLATSYAVHEFDGNVSPVPPVPAAAEEKLQGHNATFPTAPKRLALRVEPSHDSLGTIISVEDSGETEGNEKAALSQPPSQPASQSYHHDGPVEPTRPERRKSARLSLSNVSGSITGAATSILSPKSSSNPRSLIRRRSTMDEKKPPRSKSGFSADFDGDVIMDSNVVGAQDFMVPDLRRSMGNSAFDQALLGLSDQGRYPMPESKSWLNEAYVDPRATRRQPQLRNRRSAPDVRQTMAGHLSPVFERDSVMVSKTPPPPVSLRTRGSKKRRGAPKASRRQSSPAGVHQYRQATPYNPYDATSSVPSSTEDLGHHLYTAAAPPMPQGPYPRAAPIPQSGSYAPQQRAAPAPKMGRPLFGQRYSYDGYRPPPMLQQQQQSALAPMPSKEQNEDDWRPNRQHKEREPSSSSQDGYERSLHSRPSSSRMSADGSSPPFRVLHSYNSPAYKGIPIWG